MPERPRPLADQVEQCDDAVDPHRLLIIGLLSPRRSVPICAGTTCSHICAANSAASLVRYAANVTQLDDDSAVARCTCTKSVPGSSASKFPPHWGDNLDVLPELPDESVDLIYLDPPFFSNRNYEVVFGDESEIRSFEDRWAGGILHYIEWMRPRLEQLHRVLKPTGSLYLHSDWHLTGVGKIRRPR